jgi:AraC-like DNA-binding protein
MIERPAGPAIAFTSAILVEPERAHSRPRREGSVRFSYIAPSPHLQHVIRDYLIAHFHFDQEMPPPLKPYVPRPEQGITFFVRGRPSMVNPITGEVHEAPAVALFGQQVLRCDVRLACEFLMFRVHFQPGALFRMFNIPLYEFGAGYFDAEEVLGHDVRDVNDGLVTARSYTGMIGLVEAFLERWVERSAQDIHAVDRVASHLVAEPLQPSVDWLARQACLSPRQFNRKFTERMGVGAKLYSRLVRFHRACVFKAAHPAIAWPNVALLFGYTDYQHLVRDFRQFANAAPNAWLREESESPEYVLLRSGASAPPSAST